MRRSLSSLLDDDELAFLGVPYATYLDAATKHGVMVIRYPIKEGFAPPLADLVAFQRDIIQQISKLTASGRNVLTHCRGGIGRAGLVACCWLLEMGMCRTWDDAVHFIRGRRSLRAIETDEQVCTRRESYCDCVVSGHHDQTITMNSITRQ